MRAMRPRPTGLTLPVLALLASLAAGAIACEATPMDMWLTMNPEAGANFDAPPREIGRETITGGTGGTDGTGGTGGAAGDTGSGAAGDTGSGGGGTGGDAGSGGGAGTGGADGNN